MKTTVKKVFAKVVGAGLLAGALAVALPGAAQAQTGFSIGVRVGQPGYYNGYGYNGYVANGYNGYVANGYNGYYSGYNRDDRWRQDDRRDWDHRGGDYRNYREDDHRDWDRHHDDDHRDHHDDFRR